VNRALAQYTLEERQALDRVLAALPGRTVGAFQPYAEPESGRGELLQEADEVLDELIAEARSSWRSVDLREHMGPDDGRDAPTLLTRTDGLALLYAGKRNELHGEYESRKTWVALIAVLELIQRGEIAVWVDFEDSPRSIVSRLLALGADEQLILECFRYIQPAERLTPETEVDLRLELHDASLVVVDAMNEAMTAAGLDPNTNRDIAAWYDSIPRVASKEAVTGLVLDHVAKDPAGRRGPVGGGHKTAAIDGASYLLDAVAPFGRGSCGLVRIRLGKDRPGFVRGQFPGAHPTVAEVTVDATDPAALVVEVRPPAATRDSEDWRPTHLMEQVSKFLEPLDEPVSQRRITEGVKGKQTYLLEAIDALVEEDFVKRSKGPNNTNLHTSIKPFREGEV
jgi:hypothetical protein